MWQSTIVLKCPEMTITFMSIRQSIFTQNEVETYFDEYIEEGRKTLGLTRKEYLEKLKEKYDGYRFSPYSDEVYNPVSVCTFFEKGGVDFDNYWVETGSTKLLMDTAKKVNYKHRLKS